LDWWWRSFGAPGHLFRTLTLPWDEVEGVHLEPVVIPFPSLSGFGQTWAIWIDRIGNPPVRTSMYATRLDYRFRSGGFEGLFKAIEAEVNAHKT
jgi:hypothetical protein